MSTLELKEENIHDNSIKTLEITHNLQEMVRMQETPGHEEQVDTMLDELDVQIQKLNGLNDTLKSNL